MIRPNSIGLYPNIEFDDVFVAIKNIIFLRYIRHNRKILDKFKDCLKSIYQVQGAYPVNSGRSALYLALKSLSLKKGDEVIVQAFTCVAVPNTVLWVGAKPVYVDINRANLGIDVEDLKKKINVRTKAIIIQHTFGIPSDTGMIIELAKKEKIAVIEDCAHTFKTYQNDKLLGTAGDMAILSFGRDKAISGIFGGVLLVNNTSFIQRISKLYQVYKLPSFLWTLQQNITLAGAWIILSLYNFFKLGRIILYLGQKLRLFSIRINPKEKRGLKPNLYPAKLPSSLALIILNQIKKADRYNKIRSEYVKAYEKALGVNKIKTGSLPLLRYPLLVDNRVEVIRKAKSMNIILGTWYSNTVDPVGVDLVKINYTPCPTAEYVAQRIINLPTYPTLKKRQLKMILSLFRQS